MERMDKARRVSAAPGPGHTRAPRALLVVRIPANLKRRFKIAALQADITMTAVMIELITAWLRSQGEGREDH